MPKTIEPLNSHETKQFVKLFKQQWGYEGKFSYHLLHGGKDRMYIISPSIGEIDYRQLNIDAAGLYFGEVHKGCLRLSIEGSQLIGPEAKKNVVVLSQEQMRQWLRGENIVWEGKEEGFVIVKSGNDFLGSGKYQPDKKQILNFVPKARRILASD